VLTGVMWYGQFFFYNLGHVRMGDFKFTSWAIHMIMLVLLSGAVGIVLSEWKSAQLNAKTMIALALAVLAAAVIFITTGNYIGANNKPSTSETSH